ncbi:MAG: aldo/keto reductase [Propioniciclava sp.]|uniref:aldo/keto reductase n=1 Tax=Propioniciclava sp. TaxID=2038686 RepID=UPI0039E36A47
MEQRRIGTSDLLVSVIGMGCNNFSRVGSATESYEGSEKVIHAAVDAGITFFDGADIYGVPQGRSEEFLGRALEGRRDQVVLATKFGHSRSEVSGGADWGPFGGATYVRNAVEGSLRRLRTDRIDLLQMHEPDPGTPIAETLGVLTELVQAGKVRHVGHSNFTPAQIREADAVSAEHGFVRFVSAQDEYSLLRRGVEAEVLPAVTELGLGFFPFYPLGAGLLTGKYAAGAGQGRSASATAPSSPVSTGSSWTPTAPCATRPVSPRCRPRSAGCCPARR